MRLFFCLILFFLSLKLHASGSRSDSFDSDWRIFFPGRELPPQEIHDKCKRVWFKAKKFEDHARGAGIFIGDGWAKKKLDNQWKGNYHNKAERNWFLPFIRSFSDKDRRQVQDSVGCPERFRGPPPENFYIDTHAAEIEWSLGLCSALNTAFNFPLVSLSPNRDPSKIYATVVFKMQTCISVLGLDVYSSKDHRRMNDHAALVLEYYDATGNWKTYMLHYHNIKSSGSSGSGGKGKYTASVKDKRGTYESILWNPAVNLANHTQVDYHRYATCIFQKKQEDEIKLKLIECLNPCLQPYEYSVRGVNGYDNCHTYVARILELFSSRFPEDGAPPLHWPEAPFKDTHYKNKVFSEWFTADSLRNLIRGARGKGLNQIILLEDSALSQAGLDQINQRYMTFDKIPQKMPSLPIELYKQYFDNKDRLIYLWESMPEE